jgi:uncharacterized repeat protein (TIGR03803 family)
MLLVTFAPHSGVQAASPTFQTLYQFTGDIGTGTPDGYQPFAPVAIGPGGVLYGTTRYGGIMNCQPGSPSTCGTVFMLTPSGSPITQWAETILHSFAGGTDGGWPTGAVVIGTGGVLYGTAALGGASNLGTVYSLTPPASPGGSWTEAVLYSFAGPITGGNDGAAPGGNLVIGSGGTLYGTTSGGGTYGGGTVFSLAPPAAVGGPWTETVLWSFGNGSDSVGPAAGLVRDSAGVLYGTTERGGASGLGTVFSLAPPSSPGGSWTEAVLHSFAGSGDGIGPLYGTLVIGAGGVLYGTTLGGGAYNGGYCIANNGCGTVFSLTPPASAGGAWTENVLFSFFYSAGEAPWGGLAIDKSGNLYGTTSYGGNVAKAVGTVFRLAPPAAAGGAWKYTVLYSFTSASGIAPWAAVTIGPNRVLYGTTSGYYYGTRNGGAVFSLTL